MFIGQYVLETVHIIRNVTSINRTHEKDYTCIVVL